MPGHSSNRRTGIFIWLKNWAETRWVMRMRSETLDKYGERAGECEYLTLAFSPISAPLRSRWRNNGLSADFLGDYVTTFLPANGALPASGRRQNEVKHAVTYIANELLENAMK